MARTNDLHAWLDYFDMLHTYEQKGFLELMPDKHEAFITLPALYTLAPEGETAGDLSPTAIPGIVRQIRTYSAFLAQHGKDYITWPFALHVVHDEQPHDVLHTIILTPKRSWRTLWMRREHIEVIEVTEQKRKDG